MAVEKSFVLEAGTKKWFSFFDNTTDPLVRFTTRMPQKACAAAGEALIIASMRLATGPSAKATRTSNSMHASHFIRSLDYTSGMPGRPELIVAALFSIAICSAEIGTKPRATASEYPAHIETQAASIGAEFMVRSFGRDTETYITDRYLTVEVA